MTAEELIRELPKGLLKWHEFEKGGKALYVTAHTKMDESLAEALSECGLITECVYEDALDECQGSAYSCIVISSAVEQWGRKERGADVLKKAMTLLEPGGKLFLITDNRLGVRYFCGDRDPFTGRNFDGIENYKRAGAMGNDTSPGRLYSKAELTDMLEAGGFCHHRFYGVFPETACPQILIAEGYTPNEELGIRIFPQYHSPETIFLEEENLYPSMVENGLMCVMANGFLIECPLDGNFSPAEQITLSMDRGKEDAMCTIIGDDGLVRKKPLYRDGLKKLKRLKDSNEYLEKRGIGMIRGEISGEMFVMPYVRGESLVKYFRRLMIQDLQEFFRRFDDLWQMILGSSDHVAREDVDWEHFNPWWDEEQDERKKRRIDRNQWRAAAFGQEEDRVCLGPVLERGYIDLVLLNGFWTGQGYVFYDQELYVKQLPAKAIMLRNVDFLYRGEAMLEKVVPKKELLDRYKLDRWKEIYYAHIRHFLTRLRNDDLLSPYHKERRRNREIVHSNRQRMNFSTEEYQRLFVQIFNHTDNKRLYLFGSGNFARKFVSLYKSDCDIAGILDNDEKRWGQELEGIEIMSPCAIMNLDPGAYKVIICIKNYVEVLRQLKEMGAVNIGIYDTNMEYSRRQRGIGRGNASGGSGKKKYHVGYVAGVFDLFHIGHLNLFRRAKEQCDYLIVGVVTDEGVRKNKGGDSFIPFEERLAIVQACKYVDEAVGIPLEFCDTKDAYFRFQFDVQFSGSDYSDDPAWLKKQEFLHRHGAELVFFPYTENTSSTKIKEMIDRKLLSAGES